jgi:hypothetical protein
MDGRCVASRRHNRRPHSVGLISRRQFACRCRSRRTVRDVRLFYGTRAAAASRVLSRQPPRRIPSLSKVADFRANDTSSKFLIFCTMPVSTSGRFDQFTKRSTNVSYLRTPAIAGPSSDDENPSHRDIHGQKVRPSPPSGRPIVSTPNHTQGSMLRSRRRLIVQRGQRRCRIHCRDQSIEAATRLQVYHSRSFMKTRQAGRRRAPPW